MASPVISKKLLTKDTEIAYGRLFPTGTMANGNYDIELGPGQWVISLFINADLISAGTIAPQILDGDDNPLAEEVGLQITGAGIAAATSASLIDYVGIMTLFPIVQSMSAVGPSFSPLPIYNKLRLVIASIAGASATNRIDYVAQRMS